MPRHLWIAAGLALAVLAPVAGAAPRSVSLWSAHSAQSHDGPQRQFARFIQSHREFALDAEAMRSRLGSVTGRDASVEISVPLPDGRVIRMLARETPLLGEDLQRVLSDFHAYDARGIDEPWISARLDLSRLGFRAMVMAPEGAAFVEPMLEGREDVVMSYWSRDDGSADAPFDCTVLTPPARLPNGTRAQTSAGARALQSAGRVLAPSSEIAAPASIAPVSALVANGHDPGTMSPQLFNSGDTLRTYRYVITGTGEFTKKFGGGDTLAAMAQMATGANRVDAVYERDLSIHVQLVWAKAFADPNTDPYPTNRSGVPDINITVVDSLFGEANHDVGVLLDTSADSTAIGFTGATYLPSVCSEFGKAGSWIQGYALVGEYYRIMMHEMGHQFATNHSHDANCNRDVSGPYEPSSGSTIMARAGRCGAPFNIQPLDDHYFHIWSIRDIGQYVRTLPDCGTISFTGNHPPVAEAGPSYTIPRGTPFILNGSGSDPDPGDVLTYCWEEFDKAPTYNNATLGPLFRSRTPTDTTWHAYPAIPTVLANLSDPWDKLPTVDRLMKFMLTVRDNHPGTGGQAYDSTIVTVSGVPFVLTSPNGGNTLTSGTPFTVTWTVGGGSVAPFVNILLSTDGGNTWAPLAIHTPNNGSQTVTAYTPVTKSTCRIKVEASGNIFYDVSNANFTLTGGTVGVPPSAALEFALHAPQPNPSSGAATCAFDLPRAARVELAIYSVQGQRVRTLASGDWPAGRHAVTWDGRDESGARASAGVYFVRLESAGAHAAQQLLRIR